jgi:hypothetical protein
MWVLFNFVVAASVLPDRPADEQRVIAELASRLVVGREYLPPIDAATLSASPVLPLRPNVKGQA